MISMFQPLRSPRADRFGVVAVILRGGHFLVIRRSIHVVAPRAYCFPGGAIEAGESEQEALTREMREELGVMVRPIRRVWQSVTPWDVPLAWWLSDMDTDQPITPNPSEVESIHWLTSDQMTGLAQLLESNLAFLDALAAGEIDLAI